MEYEVGSQEPSMAILHVSYIVAEIGTGYQCTISSILWQKLL